MNIEELINNVVDQDFSKAGATFKDIMSDRMSDALEQEKIAVAATVFNDEMSDSEDDLEAAADDTEDFDDDDDFTDEELDDAVDELDGE